MKTLLAPLAALVVSACAVTARAEIGTIDDVPAATLLLPYFEVDLGDVEHVGTGHAAKMPDCAAGSTRARWAARPRAWYGRA